jgi:diguanylate cyclase (GGDEF)-like protein
MAHLPAELARSERHAYTLTVAMLNVHGLKKVNDLHGHSTGDKVLQQFAAALKAAVRSSDVPVRMGADQFMVLLPKCDADSVQVIFGRLQGIEVESTTGYKFPVSFSAGCAERQPGEAAEQILKRAEQALLIEKHQQQLGKLVAEQG